VHARRSTTSASTRTSPSRPAALLGALTRSTSQRRRLAAAARDSAHRHRRGRDLRHVHARRSTTSASTRTSPSRPAALLGALTRSTSQRRRLAAAARDSAHRHRRRRAAPSTCARSATDHVRIDPHGLAEGSNDILDVFVHGAPTKSFRRPASFEQLIVKSSLKRFNYPNFSCTKNWGN